MRIVTTLVLVCFVLQSRAEDGPELAKELEPLRPFIGKTWSGHFKNSTPEKPVVDITRCERALNGKAVRMVHSVNKGAYGGESIIMWNPKSERIEYYYFTTDGFYTHGTMTIEGRKILSHEQVTGSKQGITEVKGTSELLADGRLRVKSTYLKEGQWVPGRDMTYDPTPEAEVKFR